MDKENNKYEKLYDKLPEDINNLSDISIGNLSDKAIEQFKQGIDRLMIEVKNIDEKDIDDGVNNSINDFDMERVFNDARIRDIFENSKIKEERIVKHKMKNLARGLIIAASILLIFALLPIKINETVSAARFKLFENIIEIKDNIFKIKSTDENISNQEKIIIEEPILLNFSTLEEAREGIDVTYLIPKYIPKGYNIKYIEFEKITKGRYAIKITYQNQNDDTLYFEQKNRLSAKYSFSENEIKTIMLDNLEIYLIKINDKYDVTWFEENIEFFLSGLKEEEEIIKFIENLVY